MSKWKIDLTYRLLREGKTADQINQAIKAKLRKGGSDNEVQKPKS